MTSCAFSWVHLSDTHLGDDRDALLNDSIRRALLKDLVDIEREFGIAPNFIFFTGDLAYGARPENPASGQYDKAAEFLHSIRRVFRAEIPTENVFLVPGNHDVDRSVATPEQAVWLDGLMKGDSHDAVARVNEMIRSGGPQWRRLMERLSPYSQFLHRHHFHHLLQDEGRLSYVAHRQIDGIDVGIAGLNTAWSCHRDGEKGKLWLGSWQIWNAAERLRDVHIAIALSHHPFNWLNEFEETVVAREVAQRFDFHLHGHEHDDWVVAGESHVSVAAGACLDTPDRDLSYSIVQVFPYERRADVFLRRYDRRGGGWVQQIVHGKTSINGVWRVGGPKMFHRRTLPASPAASTSIGRGYRTPLTPPQTRKDNASSRATSIDIFAHFSPASEIGDLDRFVGRAAELERGLGALRSVGASVAVFGEAGVGKTSLAMQLARIASGDYADLLHNAGLGRLCPAGGFRHPVAYYACQQSDLDIAHVMVSLLNDHRPPFSLGALLDAPDVREQIERRGGGILSRQLADLGNLGATGVADASAIFKLFSNLTHILSDVRGEPLVVVLDEFNVVQDKKMFAGLMKEAHYVRFILVGTAADVRMLVQDHGSVPRQFSEGQIHLRRMTEKELTLIIRSEERRGGGKFRYHHSAIAAIVEASRGMPYFTHFLGRYSLDEALRNIDESRAGDLPVVIVEECHVDAVLVRRLTGLADLDAGYLGWVRPGDRSGWAREFVLKLFACREEDDVFLSNVNPVAEEQGLRGIRNHVKHLIDAQIVEQTSAHTYRFRDVRFKVFARLRNPLFDENWRRLKFLQDKLAPQKSGWAFPRMVSDPLQSRDGNIRGSS